MKKITVLLLTAALLTAVLCGCGCEHTWADADCVEPAYCTKCGEIQGEALGHSWTDADCQNPKTCSVCGETEGDVLDHSWVDASCSTPKTCSVCGLTEGDTLEHTWTEATTEAPMTCTVCGATEGDRIITDERFHTADCQPLFGTWNGQAAIDASVLGFDVDATLETEFTITFYNDGTVVEEVTYELESYKAVMGTYTVEYMYQTYEQMGYTREAADAEMIAYYGVDIPGYVDQLLADIKAEDLQATVEMCYYVDGDQLYMGEDWDTLAAEKFEISGDTLTLYEAVTLVLTRVN